jgi:hypothetical protein
MDGEHQAAAEGAYRKISEPAPEHAPTLWRLSTPARLACRRDDANAPRPTPPAMPVPG